VLVFPSSALLSNLFVLLLLLFFYMFSERDHFVIGMGSLVERCKLGDESLTRALTARSAHQAELLRESNTASSARTSSGSAGWLSGKAKASYTAAAAEEEEGEGGGRDSTGRISSSEGLKKKGFGASFLAGGRFASLSSKGKNEDGAEGFEQESLMATGSLADAKKQAADQSAITQGVLVQPEIELEAVTTALSPASTPSAGTKQQSEQERLAGVNGSRHEAIL
jgi:hypothetical protein